MDYIEKIRAVMALDPDQWALDYEGQKTSWGQAKILTGKVEQALQESGAAEHHVIGLVAHNKPAFIAALLSLVINNRPICIINPHQPLEKLSDHLSELGLRAVIFDETDFSASMGASLLENSTALVKFNGDEFVTEHPKAPSDKAYRTLPGTEAMELQTSGTTGRPKRIKISRRLIASALADGVRSQDPKAGLTLKRSPTFLYMPLAHAGGMFATLFAFFEGRPIVVFDKFSIARFSEAVQEHKPRFLSFPPAMIRMVLDSDLTADNLASLIAIRSGTAPLDPATQIEFEERFGVPVLINYGATEFIGAVAGWTLTEHQEFAIEKRGSVGRARRGALLRVVDRETRQPVAANETGILEINGVNLGLADSWLHTSDLARIDQDGFLYIEGRADDAIIRGGFKVMAEDVMNVLRRHECVDDAIVLGFDDVRLGQIPIAAVQLKSGLRVVHRDELEQHCRKSLTAYQVPAEIYLVDELPRTISLKIDRATARNMITDLRN